MRRLARKAVTLVVVVIFLVAVGLPALDSYVRSVVNQAIAAQIELQRPEIEAQMRTEVRGAVTNALKDDKTREEVETLLQEAVAREINANGEAYLQQVLSQRYPELAVWLENRNR